MGAFYPPLLPDKCVNRSRRLQSLPGGGQSCSPPLPVDVVAAAIEMIHLYKRTGSPLTPWDWVRAVGQNNVAEDYPHRYLVLHNVEVIKADGVWHYVFDFDGRDTLEISDLARHVGGIAATHHEDTLNWKSLLGFDYERIDEARRWDILHPGPHPEPGNVQITNLQVGPRRTPPRQ